MTRKDQMDNVNTNLFRISGVLYRASHTIGTIGLLLPYVTHYSYLYCLTAVKFGEMHALLMCTVLQWYKNATRNRCGVGRLQHTNPLFL